jgi:YfiH family protein
MSLKQLPESWIKPDWPAPDNIVAFTTSRRPIAYTSVEKSKPIGPTTESHHYGTGYDSFNLALHVGDNEEVVKQNRRILAQYGAIDCRSLHWLEQIHSDVVVETSPDRSPRQADAIHTHNTNEACCIMTADCLPVLLCNTQGTQVAAAHAGWRGLAAGILSNTVQNFDTSDDIIAWLGPAISQKAFEVGDEVYEVFCHKKSEASEAFIKASQAGKWYADLYHLARMELNSLGITKVFGGEHCTYADSERFYSYRRDGAQSGRMASVIYIKA